MSRFDFATLFPTAEPARQKALAWWAARSRREQLLLAVLSTLLILWLFATMLVQPLVETRRQASNDIRTYESLAARLRSAGPIGTAPAQPQLSGTPATILSTTGAQHGVVPVVNGSGSEVRVTVADVPYEALIRWIAAFEGSSALRVAGLRVDRRPVSGSVSAELTVRA
ncbi:type II secretion system protein GspM [Rhizorhabdus sp.]|uniref:type II secretion system protein GspM n=1 Tax=Rhizorhabdus sp. TaxID=1968843 RepID=UPI001B7CB8C1|nr:type II secretion system protein GspM [Rhizorhabdus sp.]MBP8232353.1 type II secretion system protein M [Rhizorhabdus sp.]